VTRPRIAPAAAALLADRAALDDLVSIHGSPVNVLFPEVLAANAAAFAEVLAGRGLAHRICYAHKANRARCLVDAALRCGIDIDIASAGELDSALAAGFPPGRIEATGPKGEAMVRRLLPYAGLTVNVDNLWELATIARLAGLRVPVLLRLSGGRRTSRFGVAPDDVPAAFELIERHPDRLELRGVAFHLDTADLAEKVEAIGTALRLIEAAYARGHRPRVLNVGGGFRQAYLDDPGAFEQYVRELRRGLLGQGPSLAWGDYGFGYRVDRDGVLRGTPVFHRYTGTRAGPSLLADMLDAPLPDGRTTAETLRDTLLELWIEPGKALVDHAGLTVATVQFTKRVADGSQLVSLDLSRDMVTPADQEVMLDPVMIYRGAGYPDTPAGVFLAGQLCLERDMISNHLVRLPRLPQPGDLVIFVNTAAYQMDLSAAEALMHPRPPKVVAVPRPGGFDWVRDGSEQCSSTTSLS
jgi:diaminopimelate decarboxylase